MHFEANISPYALGKESRYSPKLDLVKLGWLGKVKLDKVKRKYPYYWTFLPLSLLLPANSYRFYWQKPFFFASCHDNFKN